MAQGKASDALPDSHHHIRCLDNGVGRRSFLQSEIGHSFIGDGRHENNPAADFDADVRCCGPFCNFDDSAFDLIARAQFYGCLLQYFN